MAEILKLPKRYFKLCGMASGTVLELIAVFKDFPTYAKSSFSEYETLRFDKNDQGLDVITKDQLPFKCMLIRLFYNPETKQAFTHSELWTTQIENDYRKMVGKQFVLELP